MDIKKYSGVEIMTLKSGSYKDSHNKIYHHDDVIKVNSEELNYGAIVTLESYNKSNHVDTWSTVKKINNQ